MDLTFFLNIFECLITNSICNDIILERFYFQTNLGIMNILIISTYILINKPMFIIESFSLNFLIILFSLHY